MKNSDDPDFELVDCPQASYYSQMMECMHSCTPAYMRASWLQDAIQQFIATAQDPKPALVPGSLTGHASMSDVKRLLRSHTVVVFPVVLSGLIPHMTVVIADKARKRILYYNPTGTTPLHEARPIKNVKSKMGILQLLHAMSLLSGCEVLYSPLREQKWALACGAYCMYFIERAVLYPDLLTLLPLSALVWHHELVAL